jgi:Transposase
LTAKPAPWLAGIRNVVIDPYQPYATAVAAGLPDARLVVDHFHVIRVANAAPDEVRRRVQQTTTGHRGREDDPLYRIRRRLPASHDRLRYCPSAARVPTAAPEGEAMSRRTPGVFQDPTGAWRLCSRARVAARTANGVRCGVAGSAWPGSGDLACLCFDAQEGDGSFQQPDAAAGGLVVGGVARLRASETEGVGHGVGVVAGRAQQRERLVGRVELVAVVCQFEAVVPHALCRL